MFGYAVVQLGEIAKYADTRIKAKDIVPTDYVSVENLLQNKQGVSFTDKTPTGDSFIQYLKDDILIGNIRPYLKKIWKEKTILTIGSYGIAFLYIGFYLCGKMYKGTMLQAVVAGCVHLLKSE